MLAFLRAKLRSLRAACDAHWAEERRLGELEKLVRAGELSPEDFRALCGLPALKEG